MNILWLEDFGRLQADSNTLTLLFQGVVKNPKDFVSYWNDEDDMLTEPAILSNFFKDHSHHQAVLLKSVFDYLDRIANGNGTGHDAFIIDINLEQYADRERDLPAGMGGVDKDSFHRKGGFYIYNHLIHNGVPPENICFLTGEEKSTLDFVEHCRVALMPRPESFEKTDSDYPRFREWLRQRQEDPYISLRRAVIEGCEDLKRRVESGASVFQFREFIGGKGGDAEWTSRVDIIDYLNTLSALLPSIAFSETQSLEGGQRLQQLYRLFVRTMAHDWEGAVHPSNLRRDMDRKVKSILRTFGWIMKNVRNWMAHTSVLNQLTAEDVAFLFFINMRAMFNLGAPAVPYEAALLNLISHGSDGSLNLLKEDQIREELLQSYRQLKEIILKSRVIVQTPPPERCGVGGIV